MVTRLRLDAGLYEPAPARKPGTKGRPRVKGARLPSLAERIRDPATPWRRVTVAGWYGGGGGRAGLAPRPPGRPHPRVRGAGPPGLGGGPGGRGGSRALPCAP